MQTSNSNVQAVQNALNTFNLGLTIRVLPDTTRTAQEAADALGCTINQIAKSIVFEGRESANPYLVIACGGKRIDPTILSRILGELVRLASPTFVLNTTGYPVGGVPPLGHTNSIASYIDRDLYKHQHIWAAGGSTHAVFELSPQDLLTITNGTTVSLVE